jgi:endogenous inhibitor of DNA gyrase (YacG/DUF329 family)
VATESLPTSNQNIARGQRFSVDGKKALRKDQRYVTSGKAGNHSGKRENTPKQARPGPSPANMTAFLKIDNCATCQHAVPWEFVPAVLLNGRPLAGTGVWRSALVDDRCPTCQATLEEQREQEQRALARRTELIELLGGIKPYCEFTFER